MRNCTQGCNARYWRTETLYEMLRRGPRKKFGNWGNQIQPRWGTFPQIIEISLEVKDRIHMVTTFIGQSDYEWLQESFNGISSLKRLIDRDIFDQ